MFGFLKHLFFNSVENNYLAANSGPFRKLGKSYKIVVRFLFYFPELSFILFPFTSTCILIFTKLVCKLLLFSECSTNLVLHNNECIDTCPEQYYNSYSDYQSKQGTVEEMKYVNQCIACHYTCKTCVGSSDYQCSSCFPDALLYTQNPNEFYCYPKILISDVLSSAWYFRTFLVVTAATLLLAGLGLWKMFTKKRKATDFVQMDTIRHIRDIEKNVKNSVYSDSDE